MLIAPFVAQTRIAAMKWKPIANEALLAAMDRYHEARGADPRQDQPGLDGDQALLGIYLIVSGFSPDGYEAQNSEDAER